MTTQQGADGRTIKGTTKTAVIALNASLSGEVDLEGYLLAGIIMPAGWDAANITFTVCATSGGTFVPLYDDAGNEITVTVGGTSRGIGMDLLAGALAPWRFIKLRSGTVGTSVAQTAARTLTLVLKE